MSNETETLVDEVVETPSVEAVETPAVETEPAPAVETRTHVSEDDFIEVCERVAAEGCDSPINEVAKRTGMKPGSVTQRRNTINSRYKAENITDENGEVLHLTEFKRGGGRKVSPKTSGQRLLEIRSKLAAEAAAAAESNGSETASE